MVSRRDIEWILVSWIKYNNLFWRTWHWNILKEIYRWCGCHTCRRRSRHIAYLAKSGNPRPSSLPQILLVNAACATSWVLTESACVVLLNATFIGRFRAMTCTPTGDQIGGVSFPTMISIKGDINSRRQFFGKPTGHSHRQEHGNWGFLGEVPVGAVGRCVGEWLLFSYGRRY